MLPLRFLPRPREKDRRDCLESIDCRGSSPPTPIELAMLIGGYFLLFFSTGGDVGGAPLAETGGAAASCRLRLLPKRDPLRPRSFELISPIVLDRLWPLPSLPWVGAVSVNPETLANLDGTLGRPMPWPSLSSPPEVTGCWIRPWTFVPATAGGAGWPYAFRPVVVKPREADD